MQVFWLNVKVLEICQVPISSIVELLHLRIKIYLFSFLHKPQPNVRRDFSSVGCPGKYEMTLSYFYPSISRGKLLVARVPLSWSPP